MLKKRPSLPMFIIASLAFHLIFGMFRTGIGPLHFGGPVAMERIEYVNLKELTTGQPPPAPAAKDATASAGSETDAPEDSEAQPPPTPAAPAPVTPAAGPAPVSPVPVAPAPAAAGPPRRPEVRADAGHPKPAAVKDPVVKPLRAAGEFLGVQREKLSYRISMLGVTVGNAVLEAANKNGELNIAVRIASSGMFSGLYPVDDLVETRMIKGVYLLTRVKQHEGSYRGDSGFTLMLRERKAFWVDRVLGRYNYVPLPGDNVMDVITGFYYLRNQELEIGKNVDLDLFDSNEYARTAVEVLRRERVRLGDGREVETLVVHPLLKTAGFFRRTGDITIWLTDDHNRVPVRMETSISFGSVTAELIAAETEPVPAAPRTEPVATAR